MPKTTVYAQLLCVGPPSFAVTEGNRTGVTLWLLLQKAGVLNGTVKVTFHATGYATDLTLEKAQRNDTLLAYEKDGMPLRETLRLVVPGSLGYKWISKVTNIELVNYNFLGT
jgi:DMSO/TMAO reductase YedYZ molybdopterin-dependent catalytic subunit